MANESIFKRTFRWAVSQLAGKHFGGLRDLYEIFGWRRVLSVEDFFEAYSRQDIAGRIVDSFPDATWREAPIVRKVDEEGGDFEKAVEELNKRVGLWSTLARLDRLTGLGHFGALMLGLDGGEDLAQPARGNKYRLLYLTPHGEMSAQITNWENDPRNARFGLPVLYRLQTGVAWTGYGAGQRVLTVHESRVIHVAERTLSDKSIGIPRLERIFNRLNDLEKLLGGSAEVWWQNAAALRAWIADADTEWTEPEKAEMEEQLEELMHGLRRDVRLRGVKPETLASAAQSMDAGADIDRQLDMIAGATGIPKRILIGSERGELSSEQDENNWAARIAERREQYAGPTMIRPTIDRLIALGALEDPGEYDVIWPDSDSLGESARADIALKKSQAAATYAASPGVDSVVARQEFRRWLGEDEESEFELADEIDLTDDATLPLDEDDPEAQAAFMLNRRLIANADPRTLYVRRDVVNWRDIARWAKGEGIPSTIADDMHVTIAYSRRPVDWMQVREGYTPPEERDSGELKVAPGGPRLVEPLGPKGALVLFFACSELAWRHREILEAGASWDYPDYQPHITLTYKAGADFDHEAVEPYRGPIILGPEVFEEVDDETSFSDKVAER
jgi:hypothetical protein